MSCDSAASEGAAPAYNFEETTSIRPLWKKIHGAILIIVIAAGTLYSLYVRHIYFKEAFTITHKILDYMDEFIIIAITFTVLFKSSFLNEEDWRKLNGNLRHIDKILNNKDIKEKNVFNNVYTHLSIFLLTYICGVIYSFYTWISEIGTQAFTGYGVHELCYLYDIILHFLIYNIAMALAYRYKDMNKLFQTEGNNYLDKKYLITLRNIGALSQELIETVELFNKIFGWPLILITGKSVIQLLTCLNFLTNRLKNTNETFEQNLFIENLLVAIHTLPCDDMVRQCHSRKYKSSFDVL
ncbi:7tm 7 domain containing protein [Asbolus verrucosus]|uniref:Gustatory receptor n=1 Tax=Asbolus verrucosus TaxID=1661398 RepID=A0A482W5S8_ASBVE|nr:7tm 7 domain containing protein [Asbolus verrucosus]